MKVKNARNSTFIHEYIIQIYSNALDKEIARKRNILIVTYCLSLSTRYLFIQNDNLNYPYIMLIKSSMIGD